MSFFTPGIIFAKGEDAGKKISNSEQTVSGTVKDGSTGKFLSGATINIKGTLTTTVSDTNGAFSITVPDNNTVLQISYVGFVT